MGPHRLAWRQLVRERTRLLVVIGGVTFAVVLMLMQLGFQNALYSSAVTLHRSMKADLFMISPVMPAMQKPNPYSVRRLYQAAGVPGVAGVAPFYFGIGSWRNPQTGNTRGALVFGFDPDDPILDLPALNALQERLKIPGAVAFDARSRSEFGTIADDFRAGKTVETEINDRAVFVTGLFELGGSFSSDGNAAMSHETFFRLFPEHKGLVDIGLIRVAPGASVASVREAITKAIPADVVLLTKDEYIDREVTYWARATAIGFIFSFGVMIGFLVGSVIVYQILYSDVSDHLSEYATLKAIGYSDLYLSLVVLSEAVLLSILGFVPGTIFAMWFYRMARSATMLPMVLDASTALLVFGLTLGMCMIAGFIALRRVRSADPASVF